MVRLSKILPDVLFRWLQGAVGVPDLPKAKQEDYLDLFVLLRISRHVLPQSLHYLKQLVGSFHDNNPPIVRCEVHCMHHDEHSSVVNMLIRFRNRNCADSLTVDGMTFQDWLVKGEEDGLWQCGVYEHDIHLIAGYDRGESGRTELLSAEPDTGSKQTAAKKEEQRKKRRQKKTSSKKNLTDKVVAGPLGSNEIEMMDMSEANHSNQTQSDGVAAGPSGGAVSGDGGDAGSAAWQAKSGDRC